MCWIDERVSVVSYSQQRTWSDWGQKEMRSFIAERLGALCSESKQEHNDVFDGLS